MRHQAKIGLCWAVGCLMALLWAGAATAEGRPRTDEPAVEYTVELREPQTQYVEMSMRLRDVKSPMVEVRLPVWRPGRYLVLDPATTVSGVRARSGTGRSLACEKVDKSTWLVQADPANDEVVVEYRVYCNALADRTRHVDDTHAFLSPSTVFMYSPDWRDRALRVKVVAPAGWKTATGMEADPAVPGAFVAADYDVLVDSPLEIGQHETITFDVEGVPHEIVVWRGGSSPPGPMYGRMADDFAKIVRTEREVFGELPYKKYVFLLHVYPGGGGGTEHLSSTVMQTRPSVFDSAGSYRGLLGLAAHEFFHTWNVKQLRPAGLKGDAGRYDYQHENYTDMLWVAEGTTSYFGGLCLARAGLTKPDDYLSSLAGWVESARTRPGVKVQSLAESSFDAWVKLWKSWPDSGNTTVSYYDKGAWVSLLLDLEIRKRTGNKASLGSVMKEMYTEFPLSGPGYTHEDFVRMTEKVTATSFRPFFADYVEGLKPLDFETGLDAAGLELVHEENKGDDGVESPAAEGMKQRPYLGLSLGAQDGWATVSSVSSDGPAYKAGVMSGDVVVAVNGQRVRSGVDLDAAVRRMKPGDMVNLVLFRYETIREIDFKADSRPDAKWVVRRLKRPTDEQKAVYESWLGQKWPDDKKSDKPGGKVIEWP